MVCTPLRLVLLLRKGALTLASLEYLVLDEADKLLELGFLEQCDEVLAACDGATVQRCLFSATMPPAVEDLVHSVLRQPVKVVVGEKNAAADTVDQSLVFCGREDGKLVALRQMVREGLRPPVLIFVQSVERAMQLFHALVYDGLRVDVLHAERTAAQREATVSKFRAGQVWVLIATELVARGMDFKGVSLVINYDFPQTTTSYIHRIGRTGRAGRAGKAVTFFTEADVEQLRSIANVMKASGCPVADWMLKLKPMAKDERRRRAVAPIARKPIAKRPRAAAAPDAASGGGAPPDDAEAADEGEAARPRKRKRTTGRERAAQRGEQ
jgi:ATP-dependent RNA helicase DDX52/ROK1